MKSKDIIEKTLESYNDIFADIVNVLLFKGKRIITEDSLTDAQPFSYYKNWNRKVRTQERDVDSSFSSSELEALGGSETTVIPVDIFLLYFATAAAAYETNAFS